MKNQGGKHQGVRKGKDRREDVGAAGGEVGKGGHQFGCEKKKISLLKRGASGKRRVGDGLHKGETGRREEKMGRHGRGVSEETANYRTTKKKKRLPKEAY